MGEIINFPNIPRGEDELGEKTLDQYSDEELQSLYKATEQESYIANEANQTMTPEEHRKDVQLRLARISEEIKNRES